MVKPSPDHKVGYLMDLQGLSTLKKYNHNSLNVLVPRYNEVPTKYVARVSSCIIGYLLANKEPL